MVTTTTTQTRTTQRTATATRPPKSVSSAISPLPPLSSHPLRVPVTPPSFTVGDIRRAIPPHCFQRSLVTSYAYLIVDVIIVALSVYCAYHIPTVISPSTLPPWTPPMGITLLRGLAWVLYWAVAGFVSTGLWVIGHECGHGGFANSALGNDIPGFIVHTLLLVPYFSWKISHRRHHSNTGNVDADEVFVPAVDTTRPSKYPTHYHDVDPVETDLTLPFAVESVLRILNIAKMLVVGWPAYLLCNASSHSNYPKTWQSHFNPYSHIFQPYEIPLIFLSDMGMLAMISALTYATYLYGGLTVFFYFGVPYLIVNLFLVLITFLQHTDLYLPHYEGKSWDWLRGALATVDRDYGILNTIFHHITDTHVVHHLFSNMPHYHAQEATKAVIPILGEYYRYDSTGIVRATWNIFGRCHVVKPDPVNKGVYWF